MHVLLSGGQIIRHVRQNLCREVEEAAESCRTDSVQGVPFRHITAASLRHLSLRPELMFCSVVSHVLWLLSEIYECFMLCSYDRIV